MNSLYFLDDDQVQGEGRHQRRAFLMQLLFAHTFDEAKQQALGEEVLSPEENELLQQILIAAPSIDAQIAAHAPERPLAEINKVDLSIMRLIIFESQTEKTPKKVLVDEAVELAKEYGSETSAKFVNGVLGKILFAKEEDQDNNES
jgi:transcription antitermination protein NusB